MTQRVQIIGSYLSPYIRKVLVVFDLKGIPYKIDPIVPFFGNDRFSHISPVRRIPVLIDDQVTLADSSVICQYLENRHPEPALYPVNTEMGVSLIPETYGTTAPRRGVMRIN